MVLIAMQAARQIDVAIANSVVLGHILGLGSLTWVSAVELRLEKR